MPRPVFLDEIHLRVTASRGTTDAVQEAACRTLERRQFMNHLRRAIRGAFHDFPSLKNVRFNLTR